MLLKNYLRSQSPLIIDGALATEMESRGADLHDSLWSAKYLYTQPELIAAVHTDYLDAGADVIITASYQATVQGFMARGWTHAQARAMIRSAATLAISARDDWWHTQAHPGRLRPLVAGSVGPYGAYTADGGEYRGNYGLSTAELVEFHRTLHPARSASAGECMDVIQLSWPYNLCRSVNATRGCNVGQIHTNPRHWVQLHITCIHSRLDQ